MPAYLTRHSSDNEVVSRGMKAVTTIFQLSSRVPALIEQSHLERKEGRFLLPLTSYSCSPPTSVDSLLVAHLPRAQHPVYQSLPRNPASSLLGAPARTPLPRTRLRRPPGMDCHIRRSALPPYSSATPPGSLPFGSGWDERDKGTSSDLAV